MSDYFGRSFKNYELKYTSLNDLKMHNCCIKVYEWIQKKSENRHKKIVQKTGPMYSFVVAKYSKTTLNAGYIHVRFSIYFPFCHCIDPIPTQNWIQVLLPTTPLLFIVLTV